MRRASQFVPGRLRCPRRKQAALAHPRDEGPTWCTPTVDDTGAHAGDRQWIPSTSAATSFLTGKELWSLRGGGDIPVRTPVVGHGLVFLTSAHGRQAPIYAVRLAASGRSTCLPGATTNEHMAWSYLRQGNYMQTPLVAGEELFSDDAGV